MHTAVNMTQGLRRGQAPLEEAGATTNLSKRCTLIKSGVRKLRGATGWERRARRSLRTTGVRYGSEYILQLGGVTTGGVRGTHIYGQEAGASDRRGVLGLLSTADLICLLGREQLQQRRGLGETEKVRKHTYKISVGVIPQYQRNKTDARTRSEWQ